MRDKDVIILRVASGASHSYASSAGEIAELSDVWAFGEHPGGR